MGTSKGDPSWLARAYTLGPETGDEEIVFEMMSAVDEMLRAGEFVGVDAIMAKLREREISLVVTEGLLRFCSRARVQLSNWENLKGRLLNEAARRGDTEEIIFSP